MSCTFHIWRDCNRLYRSFHKQSKYSTCIYLSSPAPKYNEGDKIVISGSVTADPELGNVDIVWASEDDVVDLSVNSLTANTKVYTPVSSTYEASFQMTLRANALTEGLSYVFTLGATYKSLSNSNSLAYVTIVTNSPPVGGTLVISPTTGKALNETFSFTTSAWSDDVEDLPLQYSFLYTTAENVLSVIRSQNEVSYASSVLGQGPETGTPQDGLTATVIAYDILTVVMMQCPKS